MTAPANPTKNPIIYMSALGISVSLACVRTSVASKMAVVAENKNPAIDLPLRILACGRWGSNADPIKAAIGSRDARHKIAMHALVVENSNDTTATPKR